MPDSAVQIPANVITFDDTASKLGACTVQQALDILASRIAALQAQVGGSGQLDFSDPDDLVLDTAT